MVTNLLLTGKYNVGVANDKCIVNGEETSIKEIPFLRFRLQEYGDEEIEYMKQMLGKFKHSVGICEMDLNADTQDIATKVVNSLERVAVYMYIDVDDTVVRNLCFPEEIMEALGTISNIYDRVMLRDRSTMLHLVAANTLIDIVAKQLKLDNLKNKEDVIGICSSPLSFGESCCLSAKKARDLLSCYSATDDIKIPSANHQNMNTCGCIRHFTVCEDTAAPVCKASSNTKSNGAKSSTKPKASKSMKKSNAPIEWW